MSPAGAPQLSDSARQALADAVRAEHAAVYAYGIVDAYAAAQRSAAVNAAATAHRRRRDATVALLRASGTQAPVAAPGYVIPLPVTDAASAAALAAEVERETAVAWRSVLEHSDPDPDPPPAPADDVRASAVAALTDCAVRAATWRAVLGQSPTTTAFPGQP